MEQNRNWKKFSVNRNCAEVCNDQCSLINIGLCIVILPLLLSSSINIALSRCDNEIYVYTLFVKEQKKNSLIAVERLRFVWLRTYDNIRLKEMIFCVSLNWAHFHNRSTCFAPNFTKSWFHLFAPNIFSTFFQVAIQLLFMCQLNLFSGVNSTFFQVSSTFSSIIISFDFWLLNRRKFQKICY